MPHFAGGTAYWTNYEQIDQLGRVRQKTSPGSEMDAVNGNVRTFYTYTGAQTKIRVQGTTFSSTAPCPANRPCMEMYRWHDGLGLLAKTEDALTTSALDTVEGARILAAGGRDLSPAQRAMMLPGEVAAKLSGAHAEVTALQHAAQNGFTPTQMAVSRTICPTCKAVIEQSGGQLTSPTTAVWPR